VGPRLSGSSLGAGDTIGARYRIQSLLQGSRASTRFAGTDLKSGSPVTIEVVVGASEEVDTVGVRFLASARRAATIDSPHVVRVLDAGVTHHGHPYVVSETVCDKTLAEALELRGSLATADAVDIALDVCDALADAHARGLFHGELSAESIHLAFENATKPRNVRLAGIGTTRAILSLRCSDDMTLRAPEQLHADAAVDARTDVWAMGVVLYTMLAGASPFAADSPSGFNLSLALDEPAQLAGVPDPLADVVDACLSKTPALRPQTIHRLAEELAAFASDPEAAAARIAARSERPVESSPTLIIGHYDALDHEKEAALSDADATAPRNAIAMAAIRSEGAVDVSDPRLEILVDIEPSVRDVGAVETAPMPPPASIVPPPVARTVPPPSRERPTVLTRMPPGARRWRAAGLVAASACLVVAVVIGAQSMRTQAPIEAAAPPPPTELEAPAAPAPAPEPTSEPGALAVIAATALPDSPPAAAPAKALAPALVAAPKLRGPKPAAGVAPAPAATSKPEPKASDDDLRRFLDDRR
jgi:eukaryotic-like serine/threonine-protein kinase